MAYEVEAMSSVEIGLPSPRHLQFNEIFNDKLRRCKLDFLDEKKNKSQVKLVAYQQKMACYYNSMVKKSFCVNDLVF